MFVCAKCDLNIWSSSIWQISASIWEIICQEIYVAVSRYYAVQVGACCCLKLLYAEFACSHRPPHGFSSFPQPKDMHLGDRQVGDSKLNQSTNLPIYIHMSICLSIFFSFGDQTAVAQAFFLLPGWSVSSTVCVSCLRRTMLDIKSFPGQKVNFKNRTINTPLSPHRALPHDDQRLCGTIKILFKMEFV